MLLTWPAPAKINLFLYINNRRHDGYHNIQTVFKFLNYGDEIKIQRRNDNKIQLFTLMSHTTNIKQNIILRAANILKLYCKNRKKYRSNFGANIFLKKKLPIGSGLGGGSSNAATTLIALNVIWKTNINDKILCKLASILGADVPIFIKGYSCYAEGIGNKFTSIKLPDKWYLVLYPNLIISTKKIFNDPALKQYTKKKNISTLLNIPYKNDCAPIVLKRFPIVKKMFTWLSKYNTAYLTGTGSSIFAEFETKIDAHNVLNKIPKWMNGFVARSTHISPLHKYRNIIFNILNNK
uniref:4-diphosphocytidyl-2-C-methyl-D-erythritol kinase n=1 Tax=Candidatus Aschnera chinzeii TaxID=1485666 RepID=A0AAT9G534_9ENTR|nr:MAG: 4-(cytidine 5'-diphospho)-2-C-methyl-D-erythritol kinase [Candidatus Aschnera chinzeii]